LDLEKGRFRLLPYVPIYDPELTVTGSAFGSRSSAAHRHCSAINTKKGEKGKNTSDQTAIGIVYFFCFFFFDFFGILCLLRSCRRQLGGDSPLKHQ
jgi:hypothetical protein